MTTGAVLMTYGAPRDAADLPRYLAAVRGGKEPAPELVRELLARYERIGWSPLVRITREQAAALERALGAGWRVEAGMRYSEPTIADAVRALGPVDGVIGIVLSPQWSPLLMGGYARALAAAAPRSITLEAWHREPRFVAALAERVAEALRSCGPDVPLIFTAHSLPRRVFESEPAYVAQLRETAELVVAHLGLGAGRWTWAYQSAGHTQEEWLRPDLKELFPELARRGAREVLVAPVQFLADHLEVLYDLDVAAAAEARACGLAYRRIEMANTQPAFIEALAGLARGALVA